MKIVSRIDHLISIRLSFRRKKIFVEIVHSNDSGTCLAKVAPRLERPREREREIYIYIYIYIEVKAKAKRETEREIERKRVEKSISQWSNPRTMPKKRSGRPWFRRSFVSQRTEVGKSGKGEVASVNKRQA